MALHIVLFEPEIPQNTGNIARTCAAVGATLHLVHPLGFSLQEKYLRRAGLDYWPLLTLVEYPNVEAFFAEHHDKNLYFFTTKAPRTYTQLHYPQETYLIFGKESAGIAEEILVRYPNQCVRIPMRSEARSLNLSNSVAVAAYEYLRQTEFPGLSGTGNLHHLHWEEQACNN
ncbi:MAG: tRNA (cytidine(34)-2'-O)-methyltransferase [Sphaerochaeta sp.]|uniref:tRNA (cytidine(34)-2'-O)-methyltransferase n=1 Tax=Sphaerochaeta sp. TaxID=1972642 RepID=UPI002FCBD1A8